MGIDIRHRTLADVMKSSACTTRPNGMRIACFFPRTFRFCCSTINSTLHFYNGQPYHLHT